MSRNLRSSKEHWPIRSGVSPPDMPQLSVSLIRLEDDELPEPEESPPRIQSIKEKGLAFQKLRMQQIRKREAILKGLDLKKVSHALKDCVAKPKRGGRPPKPALKPKKRRRKTKTFKELEESTDDEVEKKVRRLPVRQSTRIKTPVHYCESREPSPDSSSGNEQEIRRSTRRVIHVLPLIPTKADAYFAAEEERDDEVSAADEKEVGADDDIDYAGSNSD